MASSFVLRASKRLRAGAPGWLRSAYRLARSLRPEPVSPALPAALFADCAMLCDRREIVRRMPHGATALELGVLAGDFSRIILDVAAPGRLHLVDIDLAPARRDVLADPRVVAHEMTGPEAAEGMADASVDWAYVDADHSYRAVRADAEALARLIRPGGFLIFNDFAHIDPWLGRYGVHRAVCEFALARRWAFRYLSFNRAGLYDVALQKPQSGA